MTFVLAWKDKERIYCLADTAITGPQQGTYLTTSFGETSPLHPMGNVVQESMIKIRQVGSNAAVGFSGDVSFALEYTARLRECALYKPLRLAIRQIAASIPLPSNRELRMVLMEYDAEKGPVLTEWNSRDAAQVKDVETWTAIGSLNTSEFDFDGLHESAYSLHPKMTSTDVLHTIIATMQRTTAHWPAMEYGVGGAFFGGSIDQHGFHWQEDITYVLYAPPANRINRDVVKAGANFIKCRVREHVGHVYSTLVNEHVLFFDPANCLLSPEEWKRTYGRVSLFESKYWAWVALAGNNLTIIRMEVFADNPLFSIRPGSTEDGTTKIQMELHNEFLSILRRQDPRPEGVMTSFHIIRRGPM